MIAPGIRQPPQVHRVIVPVLLFALAVSIGVGLWGVTTLRHSNAPSDEAILPARTGPFQIAYTVPEQGIDRLVSRSVDTPGTARTIATFPSFLSFHARGDASPDGGRIAVLSVGDSLAQTARLSIVDVDTGAMREPAQRFDLNSRIAWSAAGDRLAAVRTRGRDEAGRINVDVVELDATSGTITAGSPFDAMLDVAPVGYSADGQRLYVVTVDQSGSSLWTVSNGARRRVGSFSPGRTRDWSLSPDATRLAFIDVMGQGDRTYAGSTYHLVAHTVSMTSARTNELGAVWHPGMSEAQFGGPGGSLQLAKGERGSYLAPADWSPDGKSLAARVYRGNQDYTGSLEVITDNYRLRLSDDPGAWVFGWVGGKPQ